jgi:hypothetical protein
MASDDLTFTVTGPDGEAEEITLPGTLVEAFAEEEDTDTDVVADVLQMAFTQRAHAIVHHGQGEVPEELQEAEERAAELFEERFGMSFGEATGHSH